MGFFNFSNIRIPEGSIIQLNNSHKYTSEDLTKLAKKHMFLVIEEKQYKIKICPISSNMEQEKKFDANIAIPEWESVGLDKPSYVCCDVSGWIDKKFIFNRYAKKISKNTLKEIKDKVSQVPIRNLLENYIFSSGYPEYLD